MAFEENLSVFFNQADFAVEAIMNGVVVKGIKGSVYLTVNQVESNKPSLTCAESDVANVVHGDVVVINNKTYHVVGLKPDGTGVMVLILELRS